jgi:hypothetical protein
LNACLTFSWPDKVLFDRKTERLFGLSKLPAAHCTEEGVVEHGGTMIRPKGSRSALGYMWLLANSRLIWIVDSVTNISL